VTAVALRGSAGTSSSLATVIMTPIVVVLALASVQAALWGHARTEARVVAQETAALVARAAVAPDQAERIAVDLLGTQGDLRNVEVSISEDPSMVLVSVSAQAPGIVRGTFAAVSVRAVAPTEVRP